MGESTKAVCALVIIVAAVAAPTAWLMDRPTATTWGVRIGSPVVALLAAGLIYKLNSRLDLAHDYLREQAGGYFNRDGFCFALAATAVDQIAYMYAYFQNQYDKPSIGRIAVRPARGFFMGRANIEWITYEIHCEPAAFGMARIAIPIPKPLQGNRQKFEVGASVQYPDGKGRRLRFRDGVPLRTDASFGNTFGTALAVAGAMGGAIVLSKPATATIELPTGVAEEVFSAPLPEIMTLWQLGASPLVTAN